MKKMKSIMAGLCACALLLTACGAPAASSASQSAIPETQSVKLDIMHYYTEEEAAAGDATRKVPREAFLAYDEENPDIETNITELQINDYETKIQALAAADDLPDIFMVKGSWMNNFIESGLLADITSYVETCEWKDDYRPGIFDASTVDGKIYAAPTQYAASSLVYYNKALWEEIGYSSLPTTWDEFLEAGKKFTEKGIYPVSLGNKNKWQYNSSWFSTLANRFTGGEWFEKILAKDGSASFEDEDFVKALTMTQRLGAEAGFNPDYSTIDQQQSAALFCQGKSATIIDGYWSIDYILNNAPAEVLDNIALGYMPTVENAKGPENGISAGCSWFIGVSSKLEGAEKDAAVAMALAITGPNVSKIFAEEYGIPHACNIGESDISKFPALTQEYINILAGCEPVPIYDARIDGAVISVMNDMFPELLAGTITPEQAAKTIQEEYALLLE